LADEQRCILAAYARMEASSRTSHLARVGVLIGLDERILQRPIRTVAHQVGRGTVNNLVSARMNKCRQMRWSPRSAHCVLQVRAAALDGRLGHHAIQFAA